MNPYAAPQTRSDPPASRGSGLPESFSPLVIAIYLVIASSVGVVAPFVPSLSALTMPRFGWIGLILCMNPLIFLLPWFRTGTRQALLASAKQLTGLGVLNAALLLYTGTVTQVVNPFHDRLHSAWWWSVAPFFFAGAYLFWQWFGTSQALRTADDAPTCADGKPST